MASYFNSKDDILRAGLNVSRSQCLAFINVVEKTQGIIIMRHSRFFCGAKWFTPSVAFMLGILPTMI